MTRTREENAADLAAEEAGLKTFRYTEVTRAVVTTIRTIRAQNEEEAQAMFDNGEWETMAENVGDVISLISADLELVDDQPTEPGMDF